MAKRATACGKAPSARSIDSLPGREVVVFGVFAAQPRRHRAGDDGGGAFRGFVGGGGHGKPSLDWSDYTTSLQNFSIFVCYNPRQEQLLWTLPLHLAEAARAALHIWVFCVCSSVKAIASARSPEPASARLWRRCMPRTARQTRSSKSSPPWTSPNSMAGRFRTAPACWGCAASRCLKACLGDTTFDDLGLPCAAVAVDLNSNRQIVLQEGRVADAIIGSIAIPGLFPPKDHDEYT